MKGDIQWSSAELVYGTTVRLPGEFFDNTREDATTEPAAYVTQLKSDMQRLQATSVRQHAPRKYMYILICRPALTSLYVMMLIEKHYKHCMTALIRYSSDLKSIFKLDVKGKQETISLDRLKPVHL